MKFGILANPELRDVESIADELIEVINDRAEMVVESALAEKLGLEGVPLEKMCVDVLLTIGGDGTILHALQRCNPVIAGINAGQLGFLTEIPKEDIDWGITKILNGDYVIQERLRLKVIRNDQRLLDCINEAVLHTSHVSKMHHFEVYVNGRAAMNVRADGLIISTPTGSTSYAMSVGGPIIDPGVKAFVIAPIAPFNLAIRPLVVPADSLIEIRHITKKECVMVLDGQDEETIQPDDVLKLTRSEKPASFVRFHDGDFYEKAWNKLRM